MPRPIAPGAAFASNTSIVSIPLRLGKALAGRADHDAKAPPPGFDFFRGGADVRAREPSIGAAGLPNSGESVGQRPMKKLALSVWIAAACYAVAGLCNLALLHLRGSSESWRLPEGYGVTYVITADSDIGE